MEANDKVNATEADIDSSWVPRGRREVGSTGQVASQWRGSIWSPAEVQRLKDNLWKETVDAIYRLRSDDFGRGVVSQAETLHMPETRESRLGPSRRAAANSS